ncbi:hypothetical protein CUC04_05675 [Prevotella intermedia]|uniref:Uncharacterized protein n=1 Tax=Prevotella intermedia TaxID=28131 RepID=A0A2G9IGP7_PREIN|nr:hypothetical protein CTM61_05575 [Prevotella intermedia]PIN28916.1 hypothetical protein CUC04_05675 [Prevotella intermedia]
MAKKSEISIGKASPIPPVCKSAAFARQNNRFHRAKAALLECKNGSFARQNRIYISTKVFVLSHLRYIFVAQYYPTSG